MDCNIILDLLPLYIDSCCSAESAQAVKEHTKGCQKCRNLLADLGETSDLFTEATTATAPFRKITDWKASLLQSILLLFSFALVTIGVALEARTPVGITNGLWARNLIIPATGFLLSLANWYFLRVYRTKKSFSFCSLLTTLVVTLAGYGWSLLHYGWNFAEFMDNSTIFSVLSVPKGFLLLNGLGLILTVVFCLGSKHLSHCYANMLGKE